MKFKQPWDPTQIHPIDPSNTKRKTYKEIPPLTIDPVNKKILNSGTTGILIEDGEEDIQEYITSFKETTDIYSILKKFGTIEEIPPQTQATLFNKNQKYGDTTILAKNQQDALETKTQLTTKANKIINNNNLGIKNQADLEDFIKKLIVKQQEAINKEVEKKEDN